MEGHVRYTRSQQIWMHRERPKQSMVVPMTLTSKIFGARDDVPWRLLPDMWNCRCPEDDIGQVLTDNFDTKTVPRIGPLAIGVRRPWDSTTDPPPWLPSMRQPRQSPYFPCLPTHEPCLCNPSVCRASCSSCGHRELTHDQQPTVAAARHHPTSPCGASLTHVSHSCNVSIPANTPWRCKISVDTLVSYMEHLHIRTRWSQRGAARERVHTGVSLRGAARSCSTAATCGKRGAARCLSCVAIVHVKPDRSFCTQGLAHDLLTL